jgi:hypothetical protein
MPKVSFAYTPVELSASEPYPHGITMYRPLMMATVTASNGKALQWLVMPDSGADACLFPMSLAVLLKLNIPSLPKTLTGGVGSSANVTYYDTISINLQNGIEFKAFVGFTEGMDGVGFGLLGQDGFFDKYDVEFLRHNKLFTIEPSPLG